VLPDKVPRWLLGLIVGISAMLVVAVLLGFIHDRLSLATPALLLVLPDLVYPAVRRPNAADIRSTRSAMSNGFVT
jgi:hypothetical protein